MAPRADDMGIARLVVHSLRNTRTGTTDIRREVESVGAERRRPRESGLDNPYAGPGERPACSPVAAAGAVLAAVAGLAALGTGNAWADSGSDDPSFLDPASGPLQAGFTAAPPDLFTSPVSSPSTFDPSASLSVADSGTFPTIPQPVHDQAPPAPDPMPQAAVNRPVSEPPAPHVATLPDPGADTAGTGSAVEPALVPTPQASPPDPPAGAIGSGDAAAGVTPPAADRATVAAPAPLVPAVERVASPGPENVVGVTDEHTTRALAAALEPATGSAATASGAFRSAGDYGIADGAPGPFTVDPAAITSSAEGQGLSPRPAPGEPDGHVPATTAGTSEPAVAAQQAAPPPQPVPQQRSLPDRAVPDPSVPDPGSQGAVGQDPVSQNPMSQGAVSQDPGSQGAVGQDPVSQNPGSQGAVSQGAVSQDPGNQDPGNTGSAKPRPPDREPTPTPSADTSGTPTVRPTTGGDAPASGEPLLSLALDRRLTGLVDPACQADPNCEKAKVEVTGTSAAYAAAGIPPTIGITAATQIRPATPTDPGISVATGIRNGLTRAPFGFLQDLAVGGAIGNVPVFEDPGVDRPFKTGATTAAVTAMDVGLRRVVNPAIDRWAATNAAENQLARAFSGGGIRTDSGLKPGVLAVIPAAVNGNLEIVNAVEELTGFGKVEPTDQSNTDYYRDIAMRAGAVGAGVGVPVTLQILKTGGDKRLIPLPFALPAAQSALSQVAFGPEPPHPDAVTGAIRGGARRLAAGVEFAGDVASGANRAVLGDSDAEDGNTMNVLRAVGNGGAALVGPAVNIVNNSIDPVRTLRNLGNNVTGRPPVPLLAPEAQAEAAAALDRGSRALHTGLRVPPANAADAVVSATANVLDGIGDTLIGAVHQVGTVADLVQPAGNRAAGEPTQRDRAGDRFGEAGRSFERAGQAVRVVGEAARPALNLLRCGSTDCPPPRKAPMVSPALTCDAAAWVACPGSPGHPAGQPRVGAATVGPLIVGPKLVGPAVVGPLYVGDGSGSPSDRLRTDLLNLSTGRPIQKAVNDAVDAAVKDPIGTAVRGLGLLLR